MLHSYFEDSWHLAPFMEELSLDQPLPNPSNDFVAENSLGDTICDKSESVEDKFLSAERAKEITRFVSSLSSNQAALVKLLYWEDLTQQEAAKILDISQSAVSQSMAKIMSLGREHFRLAVN